MDRMQLRLAIACAALLGLAACGDDDTPMIEFPDSGMTDAGGGGGTDAGGGGGTDAGPEVCGTFAGQGQPLPSTCLPRCARATLDAYSACPGDASGATCRQTALDNDTYRTALLTAGAESIELTCDLCFNIQYESCLNEVCPTEYQAFVTCASSASNPSTDCATQIEAVNTCQTANQTEMQTCVSGSAGSPGRVALCFDIASATSFSMRSLPLPAGL